MSSSNKKNPTAIEIKNLTVAYDKEKILDNLSFNIGAETITALIGPNGAGKTTLIRAILGLIPIQKGSIKFFNRDALQKCNHLKGHHIDCFHPGYVPQRYSFDKTFPITVREFLGLALLSGQDASKIDKTLKEVGMLKNKDRLLGQLSGGQVQRVLIAKALVAEPKILFLDEAAFGIDIAGEKTFYELIKHLNKKQGITCILVSHEIDVVFKYADQVICLNKKMICQGVPKKLLTPKTLTEIYGKEIGLYEHKYK
ncbi:MAG: metal ABC transporter ATP-binding protein [Bacteroidota bacterium]|nr:metal ABC transporter ATP-binding protein [Patescibacteria group bacterium]